MLSRQLTFLVVALCILVASAFTLPADVDNSELDSLQQIHSTAQRLQELIRLHVQHNSNRHTALAKVMRCVDHPTNQNAPVGCDDPTLNNTVDCFTAQDRLANLTTVCNVPYIVNGFADPLSVNISDVGTFCTGDCVTQLDLALAQVVRSCWANGTLDTQITDSLREPLIASKVACLRVEEGYCFSVWQNLTRISGFLANGTLTRQQIDSTCWSDCANEQHAQLIQFGAGRILGTTGFLKLLCTTVNTELCALTFQAVENGRPQPTNDTSNGTSGSNSTSSDLDFSGNGTCNLCYRRFVQRANKTLALAENAGGVSNFNQQDFADRVNFLTYQCAHDDKQFCIDRIAKDATKNNNHQDLSLCSPAFDNIQGQPITVNCSSACADQLSALQKDLGCCALTYFQQKFNSSIVDGYNPNIPHIFNFIRNQCQVTDFSNSCSDKRLDFSVVLVNVRESWAESSNVTDFIVGPARRDIAARLGVPITTVYITSTSDFPGVPPTNSPPPPPGDDVFCIDGERRVKRGVLLKGYVLPQSPVGVQQLLGSFAKALQDNRIDFSEAASCVPFNFVARFDVLSPFKLDTTASNTTKVSNPGFHS
jgi:hypothetical protein